MHPEMALLLIWLVDPFLGNSETCKQRSLKAVYLLVQKQGIRMENSTRILLIRKFDIVGHKKLCALPPFSLKMIPDLRFNLSTQRYALNLCDDLTFNF